MRRAVDIIGVGAALAIAAFLVAPVEIPAPDPGSQPPPPTCEGPACGKLPETLNELEEGVLDERAEEVARAPGLAAAGDTCFMRHPRLVPRAPRQWRRSFALTALVGAPEDKRELLAPLVDSAPNPLSRWRVVQALAETEIRAGDAAAAGEHIAEALKILEAPAQCRSDTLRLLAMTREGVARLEAAFAAAEADPASYLAQLDLALTAAAQDESRASACESSAVGIIRAVVQLDALVERDRQLAVIERLLGPDPVELPALLLAGMVQERSARMQAALGTYEKALAVAPTRVCGEIYAEALERRRAFVAAELAEQRG